MRQLAAWDKVKAGGFGQEGVDVGVIVGVSVIVGVPVDVVVGVPVAKLVRISVDRGVAIAVLGGAGVEVAGANKDGKRDSETPRMVAPITSPMIQLLKLVGPLLE